MQPDQNGRAQQSRRSKGNAASVQWHNLRPEAEAGVEPVSKKIKVKYGVFTQNQTGGVSSRSSFVNINASPKKSQEPHSDINWNDAPCDTPDEQELCWVDPDFQNYIEDIYITPPKRKRTAGVSIFFIVT